MNLQEYLRILKMAKKPTGEEFIQMLKITGLGFIALGILGYIFQLIAYLIALG